MTKMQQLTSKKAVAKIPIMATAIMGKLLSEECKPDPKNELPAPGLVFGEKACETWIMQLFLTVRSMTKRAQMKCKEMGFAQILNIYTKHAKICRKGKIFKDRNNGTNNDKSLLLTWHK